MKNVMLNAIPKSQFLRLVTEATNDFKKVYEKGVDIAGTNTDDKLAGVKRAIADSGIKKSVADVFINMMLVALGTSVAAIRKPTAEELQKQFLVFVPYACVVPLRNRNHHAYTIGQPVIMIHGKDGKDSEMFGLDDKGCIISKSATAVDGLSHLPRLRKSLRPATNYEINQIVDKLYT